MKIITITTALVAAMLLGTSVAAETVPTVSNVSMQQISDSRMVEIKYDLGGADAIVTLSIETNGAAIPDSAVTRLLGDVNKKVVADEGRKSITWNAGADWPENLTATARARVTAWYTNAPPQYCAIDVVNGPSVSTYPLYYYPSAEGVPGGVTNEIYKTTRILLRKLPATGSQGFKMGSPGDESHRGSNEDWHDVVLTKDFYVGVYEVTQSQYRQIMNSRPSMHKNTDYWMTRPVEKTSYNHIRGSSAGSEWPDSSAVDDSSFMGKLRTKTGLTGLDLPTDAQWEYACRAGTSGALNGDLVNLTNRYSDARLDLLGRYSWNGGKIDGTVDPDEDCGIENATTAVGSYAPNDWGLYDMHGNVLEWCLDWYTAQLGTELVVDPKGVGSDGNRVRRGGGWGSVASECRSAHRSSAAVITAYGNIGFRLVCNLD